MVRSTTIINLVVHTKVMIILEERKLTKWMNNLYGVSRNALAVRSMLKQSDEKRYFL